MFFDVYRVIIVREAQGRGWQGGVGLDTSSYPRGRRPSLLCKDEPLRDSANGDVCDPLMCEEIPAFPPQQPTSCLPGTPDVGMTAVMGNDGIVIFSGDASLRWHDGGYENDGGDWTN